jgi:nucleoside-diphosphate-sugar epimerase
MKEPERRVLVTGATGFIGARLVEILAGKDFRVRALARRRGPSAIFDARREYVRGDVTDTNSLLSAMRGCEVVFHCAWGGINLSDARRINVQGSINVLTAAEQAGVRRVVHLSSMAVHGTRLPAVVQEDLPLWFSGDPYSVTKAEGELISEFARRRTVEVVVLRPSLVYGPGSPMWLLRYVERVRSENIALIDGGCGLANLVYVDDLVAAMELAADCSGVHAEAFLVSGAAPVTWRDYLGSVARLCGKPRPPSVSLSRARFVNRCGKLYFRLTGRPSRYHDVDVLLMTQHATVSIAKARRVLNYEPRIGFEEGMSRCGSWLYREGYLPESVLAKRSDPVNALGQR